MRRLALVAALLLYPSIARADGAVVVPPRASDPIELGALEQDVAVSLRGATSVRGVEGCGETLFGAALEAGDLFVRRTADGAETSLRFARRPAVEQVVWDLDAGRVAGFARGEDETIELLDAHDHPRVRVRALDVVDATGARHPAEVSVEGCDAGAGDPAVDAPRGHVPRHDTCEVRVRWGNDGEPLVYPVVVETAFAAIDAPDDDPELHARSFGVGGGDGTGGGDGAAAMDDAGGCDLGGTPQRGVTLVAAALVLGLLARRAWPRPTRAVTST